MLCCRRMHAVCMDPWQGRYGHGVYVLSHSFLMVSIWMIWPLGGELAMRLCGYSLCGCPQKSLEPVIVFAASEPWLRLLLHLCCMLCYGV